MAPVKANRPALVVFLNQFLCSIKHFPFNSANARQEMVCYLHYPHFNATPLSIPAISPKPNAAERRKTIAGATIPKLKSFLNASKEKGRELKNIKASETARGHTKKELKAKPKMLALKT